MSQKRVQAEGIRDWKCLGLEGACSLTSCKKARGSKAGEQRKGNADISLM